MIFQRSIIGLVAVVTAVAATGCASHEEQLKSTAMEDAVNRDRAIATNIMNKLNSDVMLKKRVNSFQIMTVRGETTVYGVVNSELEREHAEEIAQDTDGVKSVASRIKLSTDAPPAQQTASATTASIR